MNTARCLVLSALLCAGAAAGQTPAPGFSGTTFDGQRYELAERRGRVVMVVLWRTDCAVCLSKLPELRTNAQGWKAAPFDLVLVNLDTSPADAQSYDRARRTVTRGEPMVFSFWHGSTQLPAAWRGQGRLPRTLVIDREGLINTSHEGRVPPEVWNQVADLLP
jgi:cytochrome c biogenesis protein CcmG/thiol:disulfide interchange protein DsbE